MKILLILSTLIFSSFAQAEESELFIFKIHPDNTEMTPPTVEVNDISEPTSLQLDFIKPCDIKCGVRTTGMVIAEIAANGESYEIYRRTLIMPNYEP